VEPLNALFNRVRSLLDNGRITALLAVVLTTAMLALSAVQLSDIFWRLMLPVAAVEISGNNLVEVDRGRRNGAVDNVDLASVSDALRFDSQTDLNNISPINATETQLALVLHGTIVASDNVHSRAIISSQDSQSVFRPGDAISDSSRVNLIAVHETYVLLDNQGVTETLRIIPNEEEAASALNTGQAELIANTAASDSSALSELASRPVAEWLRIRFVNRDDGVQGLQVRHGSRVDMLRSIGIELGDVITAVDGQSIQSPAQLAGLQEKMTTSGSFTLQIHRAGTMIDLDVNPEAFR